MNMLEAARIRQGLKLRWNDELNSYQVRTITIGCESGEFKWIIIRPQTARWYSKQFNIPMPTIPDSVPDIETPT